MSAVRSGRGPYNTGVRRRSEIVDAAVRVFARYGYTGSTIKQVADVVGVTPAAVLRYFSKEELLTEVLRYWDAHQPLANHEARGVAHLRDLVVLMRYHVENRGFLELYLTFATEASDPRHPAHAFLKARHERTIATMRDQLAFAMADGAVRPMTTQQLQFEASALCAVLDGFEIQWLLNPEVDLPGLVEAYIEQWLLRWSSEVPVPLRAAPF